MSADALAPLIERLARARGIGDAYHSYKGELKHFTLKTKTAILRAMHCRVDDAAALETQIRESEAAHPVGLVGDVVVARFDHADLNRDPLFAGGVIPTTENLVRAAWDLLLPKLGAERLYRLRLWEDPTFHVEYFG